MRNQAGEKGETEEARAETGTGKAAVGAKPGGTKGNKQKAEYEEPGKKTRETRPERTGKARKPQGREAALDKPL